MVVVSGAVLVVVVVVRVVVVRVVVMRFAVVRVAVGAAFWFEGRALVRHAEAETAHHVVEHVVVLIGEPTDADLEGNVPIAEMICGAREQQRIFRRRHAQGFIGGDDFVRLALVRDQPIAVRENAAARQHDPKLLAAFEERAKSRLMPCVVAEDQPPSRWLGRPMNAACRTHGNQNRK
jgi:hypothetical protein